MPDPLPAEAVQAAARAMVTIYQGYQADGTTRVDEEAARAALEAAAPAVASQVRREVAEQIAAGRGMVVVPAAYVVVALTSPAELTTAQDLRDHVHARDELLTAARVALPERKTDDA